MEWGTEPPTISVSPKGDGSIAVSGFNFSPNDPVHIRIVDAALTNLFFTSKSNSGALQQFRLYLVTYLKTLSITAENMGPHAMRVAAATNALDNGADIAKVQEWLGHANIATTRIYDHRKIRPEDNPISTVNY